MTWYWPRLPKFIPGFLQQIDFIWQVLKDKAVEGLGRGESQVANNLCASPAAAVACSRVTRDMQARCGEEEEDDGS